MGCGRGLLRCLYIYPWSPQTNKALSRYLHRADVLSRQKSRTWTTKFKTTNRDVTGTDTAFPPEAGQRLNRPQPHFRSEIRNMVEWRT